MNYRANSFRFHCGINGSGYFDLSCYLIFLTFDSMGLAVLDSSLLSGKAHSLKYVAIFG